MREAGTVTGELKKWADACCQAYELWLHARGTGATGGAGSGLDLRSMVGRGTWHRTRSGWEAHLP